MAACDTRNKLRPLILGIQQLKRWSQSLSVAAAYQVREQQWEQADGGIYVDTSNTLALSRNEVGMRNGRHAVNKGM